MALRDSLILASDVQIIPTATLTPAVRRRLGATGGDAAISRLRGRAPAKLISQQSAELLEYFRTAQTIVTAVNHCAVQFGMEPEALLRGAFPLLKDCYNSRFLVPADSDDARPTLPSRARGDAIARYRVLRCLQVLDDTELFQVRDPGGKLAALKLARPGRATPDVFRREAAALAYLDGSDAPRLLATGRYQRRTWIAMSWCDGVAPELACRELRSSGQRGELLELLITVAGAYARLHTRGVLHGDVHPGNLLIGRNRAVTLVDFGLARPIPPRRLAGTASRGAVLEHVAPEQAQSLLEGKDLPAATASSEQYAVGVLLYRLATGRMPLQFSLDRATVLQQICAGKLLPFAKHGMLPWPALETVLHRALHQAPPHRFASIHALVSALESLRSAVQVDSSQRQPTDDHTMFEATVGQFVRRAAATGQAIRRQGRAPHCSVMLGRSGTAYALYRLALIRSDPQLLALADVWLSRVEQDASHRFAFESPDDGLEREGLGLASPFHAELGVATTRALLAIAMGDDPAARRAIAQMISHGAHQWPSRDLTLGRCGITLAAAMVLDALPVTMETSRAALEELGRGALVQVWRELEQLGPIGGPGAAEDFGAAHGWAGIALVTLRWSTVTGDPLPATLAERLSELARSAEPLGRGVHWPQRVTGAAASLLATNQVAGWCNGPAGMVPMLAMAIGHGLKDEVAGLAEASAWSAWEAPSEVFDLCCGLAGRSYALLSYYRLSGEPIWIQRAHELGRQAIARFRSARTSLPRPLSLFKGEAGIAVLAADLQQPDRARFPFFEPEGFPAHLRDGRPA
jgi:serine/threonine protein kinase